MVDTKGVLAELQRASVLHSEEIATARHHARKCADAGRNWQSRFTPDVRDEHNYLQHLKGKWAETGFQIHAEDHGNVDPEETPIRFRYGLRSLTYDFSFRDANDQKRTVEIKSGTKTFAEVSLWYYDVYGMPVNADQVRSGKGLRDYFVYCVVDRTELMDPLEPVVRVAVIGWCRWDTIIRQPLQTQMTDPCYIVPIMQLRPMNEFYNFLKSGIDLKTENVKAIQEAENAKCQQ